MSRAVTVVRVLLVLAGAAVLVRGGYLLWSNVRPAQYVNLAFWLAGGLVLHDAVLAPVSLLLGRAVGRVVRPGAVLRGVWLAGGCAVLLAYPLLKGAQIRRNPTVVPGDPGVDLALALALIVLGALLAAGVRLSLRRMRPAT